MKKLFTLIELIVVIVVLGILAAIVIPNVSSFKKEAIRSEIASNIKNLQTATDRYSLNNNGQKPTILKSSANDPQRLASEKLFPGYISKKESDRGFYWVDYNGQVWGSTIDAPSRIVYEDAKLSWTAVPGAQSYQIYGVKDVDVKGSLNEKYYRYTPLKKAKNSENKLVLNEENLNANGYDYLLVSAVDQYGFETVPSGEEYLGYAQKDDAGNYFPIQGDGVFYLTTNAHGRGIWDAIVTKEEKPEGTEIKYSFATSDNGKDYTSYVESIESLPKSQYMKVKVDMIAKDGKKPTLKYLKVKFHLDGEEQAKSITDPIFTMEEDEYYSEIIQMPESGYYRDVILEEENVTIGESTKIKYQSSTDGINFSEPTFYPEELPPGEFIRIIVETEETVTFNKVTVIQTNADPNVVPLEELVEGNVIPSVPPKEETGNSNEVNWVETGSMEIIEDASDIADWISIEKRDSQPEGTKIEYSYYTSNDEITWSSPLESIEEALDSRFLKVGIRMLNDGSNSNQASIQEMTINYIVNGKVVNQKYISTDDSTLTKETGSKFLEGYIQVTDTGGGDRYDVYNVPMDVTKDGSKVLYRVQTTDPSTLAGFELFIFDVKTRTKTSILKLKNIRTAKFSDDGTKVIYADGANDVIFLDLTTGESKKIYQHDSADAYFAELSMGSTGKISWNIRGHVEYIVMDLVENKELLRLPYTLRGLTISEDETKVYYSENLEFIEHSLITGEKKVLGKNTVPSGTQVVNITPNGKYAVVLRGDYLYHVDILNEKATMIRYDYTSYTHQYTIQISNDGRYVYAEGTTNSLQTWKLLKDMHTNTNGNLTIGQGISRGPILSEDGQYLAWYYTYASNHKPDVYFGTMDYIFGRE